MPTDMERQLAERPAAGGADEQVSKLTASSPRRPAAVGAAAAVGTAEQRAAREPAPADVGDDAQAGAGGGATARPSSPPRRAARASPLLPRLRDGPLTEPLAPRGLTEREKRTRTRTCRGRRSSTAAAWREEEPVENQGEPGGRARGVRVGARRRQPVQRPDQVLAVQGVGVPAERLHGARDAETDDLSKMPSLALQFVYGYAGGACARTCSTTPTRRWCTTAALGVVYDKERHEQLFFLGHDDDVTALDLHPNGVTVCSGQVGDPRSSWSCAPTPRASSSSSA